MSNEGYHEQSRQWLTPKDRVNSQDTITGNRDR